MADGAELTAPPADHPGMPKLTSRQSAAACLIAAAACAYVGHYGIALLAAACALAGARREIVATLVRLRAQRSRRD